MFIIYRLFNDGHSDLCDVGLIVVLICTSLISSRFGLRVQNEAGQKLTEFSQENALIIANTLYQQDKRQHMDITRWSVPMSD